MSSADNEKSGSTLGSEVDCIEDKHVADIAERVESLDRLWEIATLAGSQPSGDILKQHERRPTLSLSL